MNAFGVLLSLGRRMSGSAKTLASTFAMAISFHHLFPNFLAESLDKNIVESVYCLAPSTRYCSILAFRSAHA